MRNEGKKTRRVASTSFDSPRKFWCFADESKPNFRINKQSELVQYFMGQRFKSREHHKNSIAFMLASSTLQKL